MVKYLPLPSRTHRLGGWGRWKDERIQRNEKLRVVKLHTHTSHSIVPRAVRPSRDWRGGRWEIPGDQVVERGALPARFFHVCPIAGCHVPLAHLDTLIQLMIDMLVFRRSQFFK